MQRNKTPLHGEMEPITIGGGETTQKITMEEIEELHAEQHGEERIEGKQCICVSSSFRAVQLAFSKLWRENEEIPKRDKFLTFYDDKLFIDEMDERVREKG